MTIYSTFIISILIAGCGFFVGIVASRFLFHGMDDDYEPIENVDADSFMSRIWRDDK